ncbi:MAG: hypothetical protein HKO98_12810 [Gemmatimonadetes bacterium]|nr:hypothetical protein [Gemmatimonadota bacterium]
MTPSIGRSTILRSLRILTAFVAVIAVPAAVDAQDALGPFPGAVTGPGFVVRYGVGDSLRAQAVAEALAAQPALPAVPDTLPKGVTVVLAPNETLFRRASGGRPPDWSAGVAIPSLNRIVLPPFGSDRARGGDSWRTLRHEWAHLGLRQALPGLRVPRWFDEGYAQWAAGWERADAWRLRVRLALGRTPPLDSLTFRFPGGRNSAQDAYLLSATTVEYLVMASGEDALEVFLERWRSSGRFDAALKQVYGVSTDQLEEDWRKWLEDRYGWLSVLTSSGLAWAMLAVLVLLMVRTRRERNREKLARLRATEPPPAPEFWMDDSPSP